MSPEKKKTRHDVYGVLDRAFAPSARPSELELDEPWAKTDDSGSRIEVPRPKTAGTDEPTGTDLDADPVSRGRGINPRPPTDEPTAIERILGRRTLKPPPDLHAWIRKYGGYAKITAEGCAEYNEAKRQWEEDRLHSRLGGAGPPQGSSSAPETPPADLLVVQIKRLVPDRRCLKKGAEAVVPAIKRQKVGRANSCRLSRCLR